MADSVVNKVTSGTHVNSARATTLYYNASKTAMYVGGTYSAFIVPTMPARVPGRVAVSAKLEIPMTPGTATNRTLTAQRNAKPAKTLSQVHYNGRPGVLAGSAAVSATLPGTTALWSLDVTADVSAYLAGGAYYGFRITSSFGSAWKMAGWLSSNPPRLVVEYADVPGIPTGLSPSGITALAAPTFTWLAPAGVTSARLQVASDAAFTTLLFDSGVQNVTTPQLNTAGLGWAGIADGVTAYARVLYTNVAGTSAWSSPVSFTRRVLAAGTITGPASPTADPSPTVTWPAYPGQTRWQVLTYVDGVLVDDSKVQPGTDTAYTVVKGAATSGQVLTHRVNWWDSYARTPSPGDPGYATATRTATFTPGASPAVTSFTAVQDPGAAPWVDLTWARVITGVATPADEWIIYRNNKVIARIDGVSDGGSPVWTYRDWACPPNTAVTYTIRPVITGAGAGVLSAAVNVKTIVTGAWVFNPVVGGDYFVISGDQQSMAYGESSAIYEPIGGAVAVKRTFALRGLEGNMGGRVQTDRTGGIDAAEAAIFRLKQAPSRQLRVAYGNSNYPCTVDNLSPVIDPDSAFYDSIEKAMSFGVRQTGELPFEALTATSGAT